MGYYQSVKKISADLYNLQSPTQYRLDVANTSAAFIAAIIAMLTGYFQVGLLCWYAGFLYPFAAYGVFKVNEAAKN